MEPTVSYIICSTPRSGSHLLSEALQNTQVAGKPDEYFHTDLNGRLQNETGNIAEQFGPKTLEEFRDFVLEVGSTTNGTFGIIIALDYLPYIIQNYQQLPAYQGLDTYELLKKLFYHPKYIWITRRDKVRQSVSLVKAMSTNRWVQTDKDVEPPAVKPVFNYEAIALWHHRLELADQQWQAYFQANEIEPFKVVYEELVDDYEATAVQILDFLEIQQPKQINKTLRLRKQANHLNEQWVARYRAIEEARFPAFWRFLSKSEMFVRSVSVRQMVRSLQEVGKDQ